MNLTIFNGSPRGKSSNSSIISSWFTEKIKDNKDLNINTFYLNNINEHEVYAQKAMDADYIVFIFPLYVDSMPGVVKAFIDKLEPYTGKFLNKKVGYIIHSGFPESIHSTYLAKYLESLTGILGAYYIGTAIMGGSEGIRMMPPKANKKRRALFNLLGEGLIETGKFDKDLISKLSKPVRFNKPMVIVAKIIINTPLTQYYWNMQLKKNNAFDTPYK